MKWKEKNISLWKDYITTHQAVDTHIGLKLLNRTGTTGFCLLLYDGTRDKRLLDLIISTAFTVIQLFPLLNPCFWTHKANAPSMLQGGTNILCCSYACRVLLWSKQESHVWKKRTLQYNFSMKWMENHHEGWQYYRRFQWNLRLKLRLNWAPVHPCMKQIVHLWVPEEQGRPQRHQSPEAWNWNFVLSRVLSGRAVGHSLKNAPASVNGVDKEMLIWVWLDQDGNKYRKADPYYKSCEAPLNAFSKICWWGASGRLVIDQRWRLASPSSFASFSRSAWTPCAPSVSHFSPLFFLTLFPPIHDGAFFFEYFCYQKRYWAWQSGKKSSRIMYPPHFNEREVTWNLHSGIMVPKFKYQGLHKRVRTTGVENTPWTLQKRTPSGEEQSLQISPQVSWRNRKSSWSSRKHDEGSNAGPTDSDTAHRSGREIKKSPASWKNMMNRRHNLLKLRRCESKRDRHRETYLLFGCGRRSPGLDDGRGLDHTVHTLLWVPHLVWFAMSTYPLESELDGPLAIGLIRFQWSCNTTMKYSPTNLLHPTGLLPGVIKEHRFSSYSSCTFLQGVWLLFSTLEIYTLPTWKASLNLLWSRVNHFVSNVVFDILPTSNYKHWTKWYHIIQVYILTGHRNWRFNWNLSLTLLF